MGSSSDDDDDQQCSVDEIFELVADAQRRQILTYLIQNADRPIPLEALLEELMTQTDTSESDQPTEREHLLTRLHHLQLPKLADYGVIEYNESLQLISYIEQSRIEMLLQSEHIASGGAENSTGDDHDS